MRRFNLLVVVAALTLAVTITHSQAEDFTFPRRVANKCYLVNVGDIGTIDVLPGAEGGLFTGLTRVAGQSKATATSRLGSEGTH